MSDHASYVKFGPGQACEDCGEEGRRMRDDGTILCMSCATQEHREPDYDAPSAQERAESSYRDKYYGGRW